MSKKKNRKKPSGKQAETPCNVTLENRLAEYFALDQFRKSTQGASSAWEGFQRQTAYICSRIASCSDADYYPETVEDLAVVHFDKSLELVQIKSVSDDFSLSKLEPERKDSFFAHVLHFHCIGVAVIPRVVVFGRLGPEMAGFVAGEASAKASIKKKLEKRYPEEFVSFILASLKIETCDENKLRNDVIAFLEESFEASVAPDFVSKELTIKVEDSSRSRLAINGGWLSAAARQIAQKAAALRGYAAQYGIKLYPLSEMASNPLSPEEKEGYRLGESARLSHILSGFDVVRPRLDDAIERAFHQSNVVLVRGASGQGKSTACYRYLYGKGLFWAFEVSGSIDEKDALDIAACLRGLSKEKEGPVHAYIDGAVGRGWPLLAREIRKSVPNVCLLVSIREEDLNASLSGEWEIGCASVRVELTEQDARELFEFFVPDVPFPSFDESWRSFGGNGPLMEYVFSLAQGSSLRSMLRGQVQSVASEASDDQMLCLYLASVLGAEGVSSSVRSLKEATRCDGLARFLSRINEEHLVRLSSAGQLAPLHPFRSMIIAELLEDIIVMPSEPELFRLLLRCGEGPVGRVLASRFGQPGRALEDVDAVAASVDSWQSASEVLKYALWADSRAVFEESRALRDRCEACSITASLAFMLGGGLVEGGKDVDNSAFFSPIADEERRACLEGLIADFGGLRFSPKLSRDWLGALRKISLPCPSSDEGYRSAGFVCGVMGLLLGADGNFFAADAALRPQSCRERALDSLLACALGTQLLGGSISGEAKALLEKRVNEENHIVWSRIDDGECELLQVGLTEDMSPNDSLVAALCAYRELYPDLRLYSGRVLGTDVFLPKGVELPDTCKHIPAGNLPINWRNIPNFFYRAMCEYDEAPESWAAIREGLRELGALFGFVMAELTKCIGKWCRAGRFTGLDAELLGAISEISSASDAMGLGIPRESLDSKCYVMYGSSVDIRQLENAGASAVANGKGSAASPFVKVAKAVNWMGIFAKNLIPVLVAFGSGASGDGQSAARVSSASLSFLYESFDDVREECFGIFGDEAILLKSKDDLLLFWLTWTEVCFTRLSRRPLLSMAKSRLKKLEGAPKQLIGAICRRDGVEEVAGADGMRFAVSLSDGMLSFAELFDEALGEVLPGLDYGIRLPELSALPVLVGPVRVDYYFEGTYFSSECYYASQLISAEKREHPALARPALPDDLTGSSRNAQIEMWRTLEGLKLEIKYYYSVNAAMLSEDRDLIYLDAESYRGWRDELMLGCKDLLSTARSCFLEIDGMPAAEIVGESLDEIEAELMRDEVVDRCEILVGAIEVIQSVI